MRDLKTELFMIPTAFIKKNVKMFVDKKFNLRSRDHMILHFLMSCSEPRQKEGKTVARIKQKEIAEFFGCDKSQISFAITRLQNAGFLEKRRDSFGRLIYLISPHVFLPFPKK